MATINSWAWEIDEIIVSTSQSYTHNFVTHGWHVVKLTIGDTDRNVATITTVITVYTNGLSFAYDFDDGTTSALQNPTHVFSHGGHYAVVASAYDFLQTVSETFNIDVTGYAIEPLFVGAYSGQQIYNIQNYKVLWTFKYYVESIEFIYKDIYDAKLTGFNTIKNTLSQTDFTYPQIEINITLVNNLPHWLMQQLVQLAKGCFGSGMGLYYDDEAATNKGYYCKWINAGDFVENTACLAGGTLQFLTCDIVEESSSSSESSSSGS